MLKLTYIEVLLRLIPESLLFVFSGYALSKVFINWRRQLLSGIVFAISGYLIRLLPIHFGVHSILSLIILIILLVSINKIEPVKAISAATITFILGYITEVITIVFIQNILKKDITIIFANPTLKILYGMPSLLILGSIVGSYYVILLKLNKLSRINYDFGQVNNKIGYPPRG